jgi:hypothetical protein
MLALDTVSSAQFRLHLLPAQCGHYLNPIEGFWHVMKNRTGAGRCFPDLPQLYRARVACSWLIKSAHIGVSWVAHSASNLVGVAQCCGSILGPHYGDRIKETAPR